MTSFAAMSGESEGAFIVPIVFFTIVVLCGTVYIVSWLTKRSKDKIRETSKTQVRGTFTWKKALQNFIDQVILKAYLDLGTSSNLQQKSKSSASKPLKKKAPLPKVATGTPQHKFDHPHLLATLKGHTGPLTGGDFSSNGKQFITSAEVVKACPFVVPCVEDKECKKQYKALNHYEDDANMWTPTSLSSCSNTPSDTEDSLTSSSSCSSKMSRRQKKNKKRKKANSLMWEGHKSNKSNKNDNNNILTKSDDIRIESVSIKSKRNQSPLKSGRSAKLSKCGFKSDAEMHKLLLPLCVEVQERILSGYPYQTYRGTYVFKSFGFSRLEAVLGNHRLVDAEIKDVDLKNSSDMLDDDSSQNFMENSSDFNDNFKGDSNFQKCERCRQFFDVCGNGKTLCLFHPKKAVLTSEGSLRYTCCNSLKNGGGCQVYNYHVFHHLSLGINGPLSGYVSTRPLNRPPRVFGLDCEMVFTTFGFEVARATLVNVLGEPMIDSFVIPEGEVLDYNTQFSGVTEQNLVNALTFKEMQDLFLNIVSSCDILVGHSLEGDLVVLKLLHRRVVDSSLLFLDSPHENNVPGASPLPRRQGLKSLVKEHLGQDIQVGGSCGHDSLEDATASLNLVLNKVCGESFRSNQRRSKIAPIPPILHAITA